MKKKREKEKQLTISFFLLLVLFLFFLGTMFFSPLMELVRGPGFFILLFSLFFSGVRVYFLARKKKKDQARKFFFFSGAGAIGFFLGSVLHNFFYALAIMAEAIKPLHLLFEALEVGFFILATLVSPLVFLIGLIGVIVYLIKGKGGEKN